MSKDNKPKSFLAFTIGPIVRTISQARKTRELWAASFIFSQLMKELLLQLDADKIMLPHFTQQYAATKFYGAGLWPDRCILAVEEKELPDITAVIKNALEKLGAHFGMKSQELQPHFQINVLKIDWTKGGLENGINDDDKIPIHRINRLLDNLELNGSYQQVETSNLNTILSANILKLYDLGYDIKGVEKVFIRLNDGSSIRLPSLPEIGTVEIKTAYQYEYDTVLTEPLDEKIKRIRHKKGRAKDLIDSEAYNEQLFVDLKKLLPKETIKLRHKYVAIVTADGDNLGDTISRLWTEDKPAEVIHKFSDKLMSFSKSAVEKIVEFGGLPIYAGGDDLLFLAPLTNMDSVAENVFQLCRNLDDDFRDTFENYGATLSFGVAINYYKHPLGEAVLASRELEKKAKEFKIFKDGSEKPIHKKHALAFQVEKHSGQQFGATLWMGGDSFSIWADLLSLKVEKDIDDSFLTSVMHKLEAIPTLLVDTCARNTLTDFRQHHFNEGGLHDKAYLKKVFVLASMVYEEYGTKLNEYWERDVIEKHNLKDRAVKPLDVYKTNILFAGLRLKQFLIQKDHD